MPDYDLIVIGAGPGGYVAAARAADLGMKVACVDKGWLGGTCLQVGCIPSKALLEATHHWAQLQDGLDDQGIVVGELRLDLAAMMARKNKIVDTMTKGVGALFKGKGVDYVVGSARLAGGGRVVVDGADDLHGKRHHGRQHEHVGEADGATIPALSVGPVSAVTYPHMQPGVIEQGQRFECCYRAVLALKVTPETVDPAVLERG